VTRHSGRGRRGKTPSQSRAWPGGGSFRATDQIAKELQLSLETVRNHIRGILRALGVHSRLEAVVVARGVTVGAS
jgi:hypothetical protein